MAFRLNLSLSSAYPLILFKLYPLSEFFLQALAGLYLARLPAYSYQSYMMGSRVEVSGGHFDKMEAKPH